MKIDYTTKSGHRFLCTPHWAVFLDPALMLVWQGPPKRFLKIAQRAMRNKKEMV